MHLNTTYQQKTIDNDSVNLIKSRGISNIEEKTSLNTKKTSDLGDLSYPNDHFNHNFKDYYDKNQRKKNGLENKNNKNNKNINNNRNLELNTVKNRGTNNHRDSKTITLFDKKFASMFCLCTSDGPFYPELFIKV